MAKPNFLRGINLTKTEKDRYTNLCSNWLKINKHLNDFSEDELKKMMLLELQTTQRLHILHRLKRRYDRVRGDRERSEMIVNGHSLPKIL